MAIRTDPIVEHSEPDVVMNPLRLVGIASVVGLATEVLLHSWLVDELPPGIGVTIAVLLVVTLTFNGERWVGSAPTGAAQRLSVAAVVFAAFVWLRASPALAAINLLTTIGLLGAVAFTYHRESTRPLTVTSFGRAGRDVAFHGSFGAALVMTRDLPELESPATWTRVRPVLVGVAIALPLLLVFSGLFVSADEVFGDTVRRITGFELSDGVTIGLVLAAVFTWVSLGLLRRAVTRPSRSISSGVAVRRLVGAEATTVMVLLNSLFAVFVGFQVFEVIASYQSPEVSYAQQARNGFFQLVAVAAIVVIVILFIDWWVDTDPVGSKKLHALHTLLIGLTAAVLVAAVVRMGFYVDAFGLTELRVYTTAFMLWIAFMLAWLALTVLTGNRDRFARPALGALLVTILALNLVNPDGLIAAYNLDHQARTGPAVDTVYLTSGLSADAVPAILTRLDLVGDTCAKLDVVEQINIAPVTDIRSWNLARSQATGMIDVARTELALLCEP